MMITLCILCLLQSSPANPHDSSAPVPESIRPFFEPPAQYAGDFGPYGSPLTFNDGTSVRTPADWQKRRREILAIWHSLIGSWPPLIDRPEVQYLEQTHRDSFTQHKVTVEIAPGKQTVSGYLLVPDRKEPDPSIQIRAPHSALRNPTGTFPAVLVVFYDAETGVGLGKEGRDFGYQLARRGFVVLSIGTPEFASLKPPYKPLCETAEGEPPLQPLSALAYVAANCHTALANMPNVDPARIGIVGHSYGGKWAMFASCLYEKFACAVWSDPGIVFDETRPNINYWEPWYLGWDASRQRERGVPSDTNPRTGPYKTMMETGRNLRELHALMASRPFLVSGGAEDPPKRWLALNHTIAVNTLLGYTNRVAMTNRETHDPTPQSNEQLYAFFEHFLKSDR
jgi:dienelactone hydrolase